MTLLFQTKFATFTPDQFTKAFKGRDFTMTQGPANISANPGAPPIQTNYFSKDNLVVFYNANENLMMFQIVNTLDFNELYEKEIKQILIDLNFVEDSAKMMGLECSTRVSSPTPPSKSLTSLIKPEFILELKKVTGIDSIEVFTITLNTSDNSKESLRITLEPLVADKAGTYVVALWYRTSESSKFNDFVVKFGEEFVKKIAEEASKYV